MQLKCIVIDNEKGTLELIKEYLCKLPSLQLVDTFSDVGSTYEFLKNHQVDLLFIDINMPACRELIYTLQNKLITIFTASYKKYAFKGFELGAIDYLLKPIPFDRFKSAINKALLFHNYKQVSPPAQQNSLVVRSGRKMIKIVLTEIEYIQGVADYIRINLINDKPVLTLMTFNSILEKLPASEFKRIHRSYIVPVSKIKLIKGKRLLLFSMKELPVSDSYIDFLNQWKSINDI